MKSRETKQKDLVALQESLQNSKSAVVVSFSGLTVTKDQEFRKSLREAGASYQVVKNTLARIAVKGTQFEEASDHFKGVTAIAWTQDDPVVLTKAISKFPKDNADIYKYKTGVLDGKVIDYTQLQSIANLPSKDELISKLLFVLSSSARGIVTVINAVPRNLAVVIKQIGDAIPAEAAAPAPEVKAEEPAADEAVPAEAAAPADVTPAADEAAPAEAAAPEEHWSAVERYGAAIAAGHVCATNGRARRDQRRRHAGSGPHTGQRGYRPRYREIADRRHVLSAVGTGSQTLRGGWTDRQEGAGTLHHRSDEADERDQRRYRRRGREGLRGKRPGRPLRRAALRHQTTCLKRF